MNGNKVYPVLREIYGDFDILTTEIICICGTKVSADQQVAKLKSKEQSDDVSFIVGNPVKYHE